MLDVATRSPLPTESRGWRRLAAAVALPRHQLARALREPHRWRALHYSGVLTALHALIEPDDRSFVRDWFGTDDATLDRIDADLRGDVAFVRALETAHRRARGAAMTLLGEHGAEDADRCHRLLYHAVRLQRPAIVVETGVFDGLSSAFILKALRDNGHGRLCSIDLAARVATRASTDRMPHATLPTGADPGWIVPEDLRDRWTLRLGASQDVLEPWLAELGTIDVFFHDSLHTHDHMRWEYEHAWRALAPSGLLLSDDVFWCTAFWRFARAVSVPSRVVRGMGFLRKPTRGSP
jgi:predicted O-methyltransferase YrrM